jgi:SPP1 family predicted phage head-tail adaptor
MDAVIDSADLNRRITIQSRAATQDSFGQQTQTWADVISCWARIEQLQGRELELAQALNSEITHQVTVRYRPAVTSAMRAVYQGRVFNILAVIDPETAHVVLQMQCSEGLNQG